MLPPNGSIQRRIVRKPQGTLAPRPQPATTLGSLNPAAERV